MEKKYWGNVHQSALISWNLHCPEKCLVEHLRIYDISNLIFVHWNCIDSIYRNLSGLVVWYLKRWPVGFPARINTIYIKLLPINDLFLKILKKTLILDIDFLAEYRIRKFFQLCCIWPFQEQFHYRFICNIVNW